MKIVSSKYLKILIMIFTGLLSSCEDKAPAPETINTAIDNAVYPYIAMGANVGIIVGIIKDGSKSVYSYGEKELGTDQKITSKSVLELASITKTFTALALADMHFRENLNLDDPIEKYLPARVKVPSFNGKKITLRQLANHTSGLPRTPENMDKEAFNPYIGYSEEKMYEFINGYTLKREPGTQYEYSNVGYGLLGQILSILNKTDYEDMIASRVTVPLGMKHTTVSFSSEQLQNLVPGYYGNRKVDSWAKYMENILQGTGSLISNLDDMLIYLDANMNPQNNLLGQAISLTHKPTFEYSGDHQDGIGLGWSLFSADNQNITWKNGGNGGYTSFIGFDKSSKTGVVILTNSSLNPDPFQTQMGFEILKALQSL
ncbi:D-alanyl-D-alanine-carboxypeptidase/endopeptidaseAmpH [Dyadobacter sp. CECT 9275]|uniref:D-alanyl-D-alanine-carboxypeptidase/endopeptidase AmpH n=1 Tax=Dyadobacter helix TaxID=2822344 RepID=A0A916JE83_9BACT|nr:serine hydrolase domain-containing protein [Dyadobacter sp. CECT 9275]CAG5006627.1 D-alanyl-D-alanine-carboxypeptidase/endopeptidaseAmpH [Dyadobacter sp. CECT 9275]